jgi:hypothetical protein
MKRTLTAFVVAPLVPPFLYWLFHSAPSLAALAGIMFYGGMIGYLAMAVAGVPAFFLIRSHSHLRLGHVLVVAAVVGAVTLLLMSHAPLEARTAGLGALYGLSGGVAFWLVWRRGAAQPAVAPDRASPGR